MIEKANKNKAAVDHRLRAESRAATAEVAPDASVILYGSRARGDAREDSDYDLLSLVYREADVTSERAMPFHKNMTREGAAI